MSLYPLFADLTGREVLVVGGGEVAARKIASLLKAGADVRLCAQQILHPDVDRACATGQIQRLAGDFDPAWLDEVWLVVAATDDAPFNARLAVEAGRRRRLVNVVDDAVLSTFQVPAVVDRSPLIVAISSAGAAPMLARRVRERLEILLDPSLGQLAGLFGRHRERIRALLPDLARRRRWFERMLDGRMDTGSPNACELEQRFNQELTTLGASHPAEPGWVVQIPASLEPDLYTLRALRAMNEADVIVCEPGLNTAALEPARRDAHRVELDPAELAAGALAMAQAGQRVVHIYRDASSVLVATLHRACEVAQVASRQLGGVGAEKIS